MSKPKTYYYIVSDAVSPSGLHCLRAAMSLEKFISEQYE